MAQGSIVVEETHIHTYVYLSKPASRKGTLREFWNTLELSNFILSLCNAPKGILTVAPYRARRLLTNMTNGVATLG